MNTSNVSNWLLDWVKNPNKRQFVMLAGVVLLIMFYFRSCQKQAQLKDEMKKQALINEQNTRALNDSVHYLKNRNGDIEAVKSAFVSKLSDLEKTNADLYREVKSEIGTVKGLIKGIVVADPGSITISNDLYNYPDGITHGLKFENTKIDSGMTWVIKGESKFKLQNNTIFPGATTIEQNQMQLKIVMGMKENKDNYEVFARSASPHVKFTELDGVLIIPKKADLLTPVAKKKRFGLGPQIGFGIGSDLSGNMKIGPFVGFGISYNLITF